MNFRFCPFSLGKFRGPSGVLTSSTYARFGIILLGYVWNVTTLCVPTLSMRKYSAGELITHMVAGSK